MYAHLKGYTPPVLIDVDDLQPALYNPREADENRLGLLETSLSYLGFVLPLYATAEGHLLSGHQRLRTAKRLGATKVPVCVVDIPEKQWKNLNLLFNRATNDMGVDETSEVFENALEGLDINEALTALRPLESDTDEFYPCMDIEYLPLSAITDKATRTHTAAGVSKPYSLLNFGVVMPILVSEDGSILNGNYRAYAAAEKYGVEALYPVIRLPNAKAHIAEALVNLISMKFTLEKQMADNLRWGGYRRPRTIIQGWAMGMCLRYWAHGKRPLPASVIDQDVPRFWNSWRKEHGGIIADIGAGQRRGGIVLRDRGIECYDWEPFPCDWQGLFPEDNANVPSLSLARKLSDDFLDAVAEGKLFSSVFLQSVLNSVPFHKDRMHLLGLAHGLCSFKTNVYASARNAAKGGNSPIHKLNALKADGTVSSGQNNTPFLLPYEDNVHLSDITKAPKVQKFHTREQLTTMFKHFWLDVDVHGSRTQPMLFIKARCPKRVSPYVLRQALDFEFNLPYPSGESIDRHQRAVQVFSQRHNLDLADSKYAAPEEGDQ